MLAAMAVIAERRRAIWRTAGRAPARVLGARLALVILAMVTAATIVVAARSTTPRLVRLAPEAFVRGSGVSWGVSLPPIYDALDLPILLEPAPTDELTRPTICPHRVLEDGVALSPYHSVHADIVAVGKGRNSFWLSYALMSTSDNSDPRTNGRTYELEIGTRVPPWLMMVAAIAALVPAVWLQRNLRGRVVARLLARGAVAGSVGLLVIIFLVPRWARFVEVVPPLILGVALLGAATGALAWILRKPWMRRRPLHAFHAHASRGRRVLVAACGRASRFGPVIALALSVASLLRWWAPLSPPTSQWGGIRYLAVIQGRFVDSDALGHWASSQWLRWNGTLPSFAARRPLWATLMAGESAIGDGRMQVVLLINTLLAGTSIFLVGRAAGRTLGPWAGLAAFAILLGYGQHFFGLTMTEALGLSLGALGTALLLRGVDMRRPSIWALGCFGLTLGLFARAGAFFVLPALVVALAWVAWLGVPSSVDAIPPRRRRLPAALGAAALALAAMGSAYGFNATIFHLTTDGTSAPNSNFSFVAFGLASGGTWTLGQDWIAQHMPRSTEAEQARALYAEAMARIKADPSVLATTLLSALDTFRRAWATGVAAHFGDRGFLGLSLPASWSAWVGPDAPAHLLWAVLGPAAILLRLRAVGAIAWVVGAALVGIIVSMPFIWMDGGWRAVAPTMPLMTIAAVFFLADGRAARRMRHAAPGTLAPAPVPVRRIDGADRAAAIVTCAVAFVIVASAVGWIGRKPTPSGPSIAVEPGEVALRIAAPRTLSGVIVERDAQFRWFGPARMTPEQLWSEVAGFGQAFPTGTDVPRTSAEATHPVLLLQSVSISQPPGFAAFVTISDVAHGDLDRPMEFTGTAVGHTPYFGAFYRLRPPARGGP